MTRGSIVDDDFRLNRKLQASAISFFQSKHWTDPYFVTLTLKEWTSVGGFLMPINPLLAEQNVRHFFNLLRKPLNRLGLQKNAAFQRVAVYEGHKNGPRLHYHLLLDNPAGISTEAFRSLIEFHWRRTDWGLPVVTVVPCHDVNGALRYLFKLRSKENYADAIDWKNSN